VLHELSIENLGVIESARLTLGAGLTVVTGETGAGKTMVLTGLALVTGGKAPTAIVRSDAEVAVAEAIIDVPEGSDAAALLDEAGAIRNDDGTITVARTLGATARSRTVVGGRQIPQAVLSECADSLITVHGQADQVRLRSASKQRETLDRYAGEAHLATLAEYRGAWGNLAEIRAELDHMQRGADAERTAVRHLRDDLAAIAAVDPQPGEDEALAAEAEVLQNAEEVRRGAALAREILAGDDPAAIIANLEAARRALADSARHDPTLAERVAAIESARFAIEDVASELTGYLDGLDADPARLDAVLTRRSDLAALGRRLGRSVDGILAYAAEAADRVAAHDSWDERLDARRAEVTRLEGDIARLAATLREARIGAGARLSAAVNAELAQLAMAQADFGVTVSETEPGPYGADSAEMTLAAHPGAPARPVADAASGGELSRIMLAIEVSLAQGTVGPGHTFVFDEVDAGVGGRAAIDVGRRLAELARTQQVLVVTHLAQVAAFADHHVVVSKSTTGLVTTSTVGEVTGEARIQEVARLLSGQEDSSTARAHALELIEGSAIAR
jgi:DNA repair protein RecN (Recombination protein N)